MYDQMSVWALMLFQANDDDRMKDETPFHILLLSNLVHWRSLVSRFVTGKSLMVLSDHSEQNQQAMGAIGLGIYNMSLWYVKRRF